MANKILIVDDDPFNLDLLEQELTDHSYTIERASDGEEALKKVESFLPDVILLDYMMPKMNGIEVVKRLKQDERYKGVPVILLTAKGSQEDKVRGLDAGADDYVVKPFDSFELLARVRSMARLKQMHDSLEEWNRTLAEKVTQQLNEIEHMNRLKRYLSPQIAETIPRPAWFYRLFR
jgi:DNA-binding response OmpR family regulator